MSTVPISERRELTDTERDIRSVVGVEPASWVYTPQHPDGFEATIYFEHWPSKDGVGQPLDWNQLQALDDAYDIHSVESNSDGRTGSKLAVHVNDI